MRGLLVVGAWAAWAVTADAQSNNQFATQFGPNAQVGATISANNWDMMQAVSGTCDVVRYPHKCWAVLVTGRSQ